MNDNELFCGGSIISPYMILTGMCYNSYTFLMIIYKSMCFFCEFHILSSNLLYFISLIAGFNPMRENFTVISTIFLGMSKCNQSCFKAVIWVPHFPLILPFYTFCLHLWHLATESNIPWLLRESISPISDYIACFH